MDAIEALALHYLAQNTITEIADTFGGGRTGGYLYVLPTNKMVALIPVGVPDLNQLARLQMSSREMAMRLKEHPRHWLSSESRQPQRDQLGGAARGITRDNEDVIISFSGMSEHVNEATSLAYLVGMDWCSFDQAHTRLNESPVAAVGVFPAIHDIVMTAASGGRMMR